MIYKEHSIYKQGLTEDEVRNLLTYWEDVTNKFTLKDSNHFFNGGYIQENKLLKQLKFSIRIDFHNILSLPNNNYKELNDLFSFSDYTLKPGASSYSAAYFTPAQPKSWCMVWNDATTINAQFYNVSNSSNLSGFVINTIILYE